MGEDNQWRQLGSIVNSVLVETRTKAMRKGMMAKVPVRRVAPNAQNIAGGVAPRKLGNGFLSDDTTPVTAAPAQLELPFGIATSPQAVFNPARAPKNARLM